MPVSTTLLPFSSYLISEISFTSPSTRLSPSLSLTQPRVTTGAHIFQQFACPSHLTSIFNTLVCQGKLRAFEKHHGKKKFSERGPQTTNTGHIWSLFLTKHVIKKFIKHSVGGLLAYVGLRVDFTWIQSKYFRKKKTNPETRRPGCEQAP